MFRHVYKAIERLVVMPGDIRERLRYAGEEFIKAPVEGIPESLQEEYTEIYNYLTEYKGNKSDEYPFCSDIFITMKKRRRPTACKTAEKMWSFYNQYQMIIDNA